MLKSMMTVLLWQEASFPAFCGWLADQAHSHYEGMAVLSKPQGSFPPGAVGGV
jgi:hypothetical protein